MVIYPIKNAKRCLDFTKKMINTSFCLFYNIKSNSNCKRRKIGLDKLEDVLSEFFVQF